MKRKLKKKGSTLVEVIIALTIIALMIIPIGNMILGSIKNIKGNEHKDKATLIGQKILEELKVVDLSDIKSATEISPIDKFSNRIPLVYESSPEERIYVKNNKVLVDGGYEVEIVMKKNNKIQFDNTPINSLDNQYAGEINVGIDATDNKITVSVVGDTNKIKLNYDSKDKLYIKKESNKIIISKKVNNGSEYIVSSEKLEISIIRSNANKLRVNLLPTYNKTDLEIAGEVAVGDNLGICFFKSNDTQDILFKDDIIGNIVPYETINIIYSPPNIEEIFDVNLNVYYKGNKLFEGTAYKNIKF